MKGRVVVHRFDEQVVLVTGSGRGIGEGIARAFARAGAIVALNDIETEQVDRLAAELGSVGLRALAVPGDVSSKPVVEAMINTILAESGRIDVVVNNAGVKTNRPSLVSSVLDMPEELWDRFLAVNLKGPMLVSQAAGRAMVERGIRGSIVNITSGSAFSARPSAAHYCASKAGLAMLSNVLALELAAYGIRVNAVAPGLVLTNEEEQTVGRKRYLEALKSGVPLGRFGEAEEIAQAVLFLASPAASYITGEQVRVNGGSHAGRHLPPSS